MGVYVLTPLGLKRIAGTNVTGDFPGFKSESKGYLEEVSKYGKAGEIHEGGVRRHPGEV